MRHGLLTHKNTPVCHDVAPPRPLNCCYGLRYAEGGASSKRLLKD